MHKKSQENFERKVHGPVIKAWDGDGSVVQKWIVFEETLLGSENLKDAAAKMDRARMEDSTRRIKDPEETQAAGLKP